MLFTYLVQLHEQLHILTRGDFYVRPGIPQSDRYRPPRAEKALLGSKITQRPIGG